MSEHERHLRAPWRRELHGMYVIAKKDAMIYYCKSPVLIFGVLFPVFFFLAFMIGRDAEPRIIVPGMVAMALFFTASAVGPLVTPWERRSRTYERLISSPLSLLSIIIGDVLAGACFGVALCMIPLVIGTTIGEAALAKPLLLAVAVLLSAACFASLGVLLAAPATSNPSQVMMLSSLVRLPLLFVSGVFVPLSEMPHWNRVLACFSPLAYCTDLVRAAFGGVNYFPLWLDVLMLPAFTVVLVAVGRIFHGRARTKGL